MVRCLFPRRVEGPRSARSSPSDGELRKRRRVCAEEVSSIISAMRRGAAFHDGKFIECLNADSENLKTRLPLVPHRTCRRTKDEASANFWRCFHDAPGTEVQSSTGSSGPDLRRRRPAHRGMPTDFAFEAPDDIFSSLRWRDSLSVFPQRSEWQHSAKRVAGAGLTPPLASRLFLAHSTVDMETKQRGERAHASVRVGCRRPRTVGAQSHRGRPPETTLSGTRLASSGCCSTGKRLAEQIRCAMPSDVWACQGHRKYDHISRGSRIAFVFRARDVRVNSVCLTSWTSMMPLRPVAMALKTQKLVRTAARGARRLHGNLFRYRRYPPRAASSAKGARQHTGGNTCNSGWFPTTDRQRSASNLNETRIQS